jgi:hypothetical protein
MEPDGGACAARGPAFKWCESAQVGMGASWNAFKWELTKLEWGLGGNGRKPLKRSLSVVPHRRRAHRCCTRRRSILWWRMRTTTSTRSTCGGTALRFPTQPRAPRRIAASHALSRHRPPIRARDALRVWARLLCTGRRCSIRAMDRGVSPMASHYGRMDSALTVHKDHVSAVRSAASRARLQVQ